MQISTPTQNKTIPIWHIWLIWLTGVSFALLQFLYQLSTGVMVQEFMVVYRTTATHAGMFTGAYYIIYILLQTPAGALMDRYGARILMTLGSFICAMGSFGIGMSTSVWVAILCRVLVGFGCSFAFIGTLHILREWFDKRHFHFMIGITETIAMLFTIVGNLFIANLLLNVGWKTSLTYIGIIALCISLASFIIIRDKSHYFCEQPLGEPYRVSIIENITTSLRDANLWLNGIYSSLLFLLISVFGGLWGVPLLQTQFQCDLKTATFISSLIFVGAGIGCPATTMLAEKFRCHRTIFTAYPICGAFLACLILYTNTLPLAMISCLYFMIGVCSSVYILNFSILPHLYPRRFQSTAVGFTTALSVSSTPFIQPLIGFLIDFHADNTSQYHLGNYQFALSIMPLLMLISAGIGKFCLKVPSQKVD